MTLIAWGLTTTARVKSRLDIASGTTTWDTLFERLIASATDKIERLAGGRRFLSTTYTNEVYSGGDGQQTMITLRHFPVTALSAVSYRAGTPDTPAWTAFGASEYELLNDKEPRRVRIYNAVYKGQNNIRVTYTAGYKIDFTDETTIANHTLPFDVEDLCQRIVAWEWKRRDAEGKTNEAGAEASVSWREILTEDDKELLRRLNPTSF